MRAFLVNSLFCIAVVLPFLAFAGFATGILNAPVALNVLLSAGIPGALAILIGGFDS